jgi:putative RNA 2'-phosphotransferase
LLIQSIVNKKLLNSSKFLSLVLRHRPETIGMKLDPHGWLNINELIENANNSGIRITLELLHEVIATNNKQRFALSNDGLRIRANQGHSITSVDLNLAPTRPPEQLFHGTVAPFLASIRGRGLLKRSRNQVHLSADFGTATKVGSRRGTPVVLTVASGRMHQSGYQFLVSDNGVWLTDSVPAEFLTIPNLSE